jgi:GNAT superfamily N-acetyltransferase
MAFKIERATLEDLPVIAAVTVKSWQTTFQGILPAAFLSSLTVESQLQRHQKIFTSTGVFYYVAKHLDEVVGFSSGGPNRNSSFGVPNELYGLYLLKDWQGKGWGRLLLMMLATQLQVPSRLGLTALVLSNNPHRDFYERLGGLREVAQPIELGERTWEVESFSWHEAIN